MPSSISNFDFQRTIPDQPWNRMAVTALFLVLGLTLAWELGCRSAGYGPSLNNTPDLWAQQREKVKPDSLVIIGDSRPFFDLDLDELEKGLGQRPLQLALVGSCGYPILEDLANDPRFHGTVLCSFVPGMFFAPGGPLVVASQKALDRYHHWTLSQRSGHYLSMILEEHLAFLKQEDLTLAQLLKRLPIPNRPEVHLPPETPPYFCTIDRERRARMTEECAKGGDLARRIQKGWIPLSTPPPPPRYVDREKFLEGIGQAIEARGRNIGIAVDKLRAKGAKIVFIRFPLTSEYLKLEDRLTPRERTWEPLLQHTGAPGIHFQDYPELASFDCPEWSHLSYPDSIEFTKRLVPHLREKLGQ
jgi:hypothetical protein